MERLAKLHQLWGWSALLLFAALGLTLEVLNGLKLGFLLDPEFHMRREMWRLAHAHGTLLSVVQLVFSGALARGVLASRERAQLASKLLRGALVLMPLGFFLGGVAPSESDPWLGIWLVPVGGTLLLLGLGITSFEVWQGRSPGV
jgi:hypothetical protein